MLWNVDAAIWYYRPVSSLQHSPVFSLALGFDREPFAAFFLLSTKDGLSRSIIVCSCSLPVILTSCREKRGVLVTCVLSLRIFFQTYACCMDTFFYFHTRMWETFWLLGTWSEEHWVSLVTLTFCVQVTASTYSTNMYSRGHFRLSIIFFVLSFKKTLQFNMWIREAHQWFLKSLLGNNSTSHWLLWVLHV